jgi:hypothetical protein
MKASFYLFFIVTMALFSCKSKNGGEPIISYYMSLSAGSNWNFDLINYPNASPITTPYLLTATNVDTIIESKTYRIFTNNNGNTKEYYNITNNVYNNVIGNDYYTYRTLPPLFGNAKIATIYLKDNVPTGGVWSQQYNLNVQGLPLTLTITNTIKSKNSTKVVNGVTYTDVIQVSSNLSLTGVAASALVTDIQYYYAPKIGMIQNDTKIDFNLSGFPASKTETQTKLKSAVIL